MEVNYLRNLESMKPGETIRANKTYTKGFFNKRNNSVHSNAKGIQKP